MKLSVVIPVYNEEGCLPETVGEVADFFASRPDLAAEIIIVDDCSTDRTSEICGVLKQKYGFLVVLLNEKNMGKGFSVRRGVMAAGGDGILFMDADSSTKIGECGKMFEKIKDGCDIVIGSRELPESIILRHQPRFKELTARLGNGLIRLFLRLPFKDTQCGFKLFNKNTKKIFEKQTIWRWGFDFELLYLAKKHGFKIGEIPVVWKNDPSSLVRKIDYFVVLADIFRILINDFFGRYDEIKK